MRSRTDHGGERLAAGPRDHCARAVGSRTTGVGRGAGLPRRSRRVDHGRGDAGAYSGGPGRTGRCHRHQDVPSCAGRIRHSFSSVSARRHYERVAAAATARLGASHRLLDHRGRLRQRVSDTRASQSRRCRASITTRVLSTSAHSARYFSLHCGWGIWSFHSIWCPDPQRARPHAGTALGLANNWRRLPMDSCCGATVHQ